MIRDKAIEVNNLVGKLMLALKFTLKMYAGQSERDFIASMVDWTKPLWQMTPEELKTIQ